MVAIQTLIIVTKIIDSMNIIATIQTSNHQLNNQKRCYVIRKAALITQELKTLFPLHLCKSAEILEGECLKNRFGI